MAAGVALPTASPAAPGCGEELVWSRADGEVSWYRGSLVMVPEEPSEVQGSSGAALCHFPQQAHETWVRSGWRPEQVVVPG